MISFSFNVLQGYFNVSFPLEKASFFGFSLPVAAIVVATLPDILIFCFPVRY